MPLDPDKNNSAKNVNKLLKAELRPARDYRTPGDRDKGKCLLSCGFSSTDLIKYTQKRWETGHESSGSILCAVGLGKRSSSGKFMKFHLDSYPLSNLALKCWQNGNNPVTLRVLVKKLLKLGQRS